MTGEGGMVTTDDDKIAARIRSIRNHGRSHQYIHDTLGYNYRMTDISAAIGICNLRKLDENNYQRRKNADFLTVEINNINGLTAPLIAPDRSHVFHQYTIRVTPDFKLTRDELQVRLKEQGIASGIIYPVPIHKQPLYKKLGYSDNLPVAELVANQVLSLPIHPRLQETDMETIIQGLRNA
jgi:dTDP-4-amino-4,6-dideoxygalactose transaminase